VNRVERFGVGSRQLHHAGGDDPQACGFKAGKDLADDVLGHCVGLDDRQGSFDGHNGTPCKSKQILDWIQLLSGGGQEGAPAFRNP
jgi:hypothetical protein